MEKHNDNTKILMGIDFAKGTVERYETSYKHTKDFIRCRYKRDDLALDELNQQFVKDYELYYKTVRNCAHISATKYLKLQNDSPHSPASGWLKKDPFAIIKFKLKQVDAVYLNEQELEAISQKELHIECINQVGDVFLFCCYTGLAFRCKNPECRTSGNRQSRFSLDSQKTAKNQPDEHHIYD